MTQVHLHLLITHLPVFGSILGALVLAYGIWTKSNQTKNAAYFMFVISAIGAFIDYLTGEGAEEATEKMIGVSGSMIKLHEESAMYSLISLVALGASSIFALVETRLKTPFIKSTAVLILLFSLISFGLVARTGYFGGQIRHTEISAGTDQNNAGGEAGEKDKD